MAKILVADDNSNIQKMVGLALKDQGIDVVAVGNGEAAVRKISDIKPDLVLADVFMPVRNGYEVCRYVKEDPALAHIPVILLVGAFDPLDEQEAQRSGADGVLKKPFVPPDPLIAMVKSALTRAGVSLGPAQADEKTPVAPKRSTMDILNAGVSSKLAALAPEKLPEVTPEPIEEFPAPPEHVKIAQGHEPLAFGSLLETPEAVEEPILTAKPMIDLSEQAKWDEESDEVEEEKEEAEESPRGGWRPGGLEEDLERAAAPSNAAPDWRDEAFHGNSPASSFSSKRWAPATEQPEVVEAAESQSVAVATVTSIPADAPVPFSGDAWAAAMAAGVEEKIAEVKDAGTVTPEAESLTHVDEHAAEELPGTAAAALQESAAPVMEESKPAEPANWAAVSETPWELEAKRASLLASTWDEPKKLSVNETQDVPVYVAPEPTAEVAPAYRAEEPAAHAEAASETLVEASAEVRGETPEEVSPYSGESIVSSETDTHTQEEEHVEAPSYLDSLGNELPSETEADAGAPKSWENACETPIAAPEASVGEDAHAEAAPANEQQTVHATAEETHAAVAEPSQPDMDELVARVLGKMNPEVLQRVTREILRPVIEAIVRDEINSKKS